MPRERSCSAMPRSGASRLRWMSFDNALSGETYTTCTASASEPFAASRTSASMAARNAASVLPEPVGAAISVCRPAWIAGHAARCGRVGSAKAAAEPRRDGGMELIERHAGNFTPSVDPRAVSASENPRCRPGSPSGCGPAPCSAPAAPRAHSRAAPVRPRRHRRAHPGRRAIRSRRRTRCPR